MKSLFLALLLFLFSSLSLGFNNSQTKNITTLDTKNIDFNKTDFDNIEFILSKKKILPPPVKQNPQIIYKYLPIYYPIKVPVYYPVYIPKYVPIQNLKNIDL